MTMKKLTIHHSMRLMELCHVINISKRLLIESRSHLAGFVVSQNLILRLRSYSKSDFEIKKLFFLTYLNNFLKVVFSGNFLIYNKK